MSCDLSKFNLICFQNKRWETEQKLQVVTGFCGLKRLDELLFAESIADVVREFYKLKEKGILSKNIKVVSYAGTDDSLELVRNIPLAVDVVLAVAKSNIFKNINNVYYSLAKVPDPFGGFIFEETNNENIVCDSYILSGQGQPVGQEVNIENNFNGNIKNNYLADVFKSYTNVVSQNQETTGFSNVNIDTITELAKQNPQINYYIGSQVFCGGLNNLILLGQGIDAYTEQNPVIKITQQGPPLAYVFEDDYGNNIQVAPLKVIAEGGFVEERGGECFMDFTQPYLIKTLSSRNTLEKYF